MPLGPRGGCGKHLRKPLEPPGRNLKRAGRLARLMILLPARVPRTMGQLRSSLKSPSSKRSSIREHMSPATSAMSRMSVTIAASKTSERRHRRDAGCRRKSGRDVGRRSGRQGHEGRREGPLEARTVKRTTKDTEGVPDRCQRRAAGVRNAAAREDRSRF